MLRVVNQSGFEIYMSMQLIEYTYRKNYDIDLWNTHF